MTTVEGKESRLTGGKRIVFLGDSITDEGTFITYLDTYFEQHTPEIPFTFVNLGISSETASGLTEADHPFPRPCVHDRLAGLTRKQIRLGCCGVRNERWHLCSIFNRTVSSLSKWHTYSHSDDPSKRGKSHRYDASAL